MKESIQDKYYTPTIEEFHVGLEYKERIENGIWESRVYETVDDFNLGYHNSHLTRIKHLDRKDVESLGWEFTGKGAANWYKIEGEFQIGTWTAYEAVMIHDNSCNWVKIHVLDRGDEVDIFQGNIKNKSELKRLLKQLGI